MVTIKHLLASTLLLCLFSCEEKNDNSSAIRDFRKSLQPFLFEVASKGFVTYHDSADIKSISDEELILLSKSENPILRATAFDEILDRNTFNQFDVVMNHLNDTAIVAVDNGEFGIGFPFVSDHIIQNASWENSESRDKTIDEVLTKHNYLRSAYIILKYTEPKEKFYTPIKDMATRPRRLDENNGYELDFDDIEYALYGLAKFKKKEDIQIIKNKMMRYVWELSDVSFKLMTEFPDTAYFDVLQKYHWRQFYQFSGNRPHGFTGYNADNAAPEDFIEALAIQRTERSALLLDTMLMYLPKVKCMPDKENILNDVIIKIWENPCPAYATLRKKIKLRAEEILKGRIIIKGEPLPLPVEADTSKKRFYWFE